MAIHIDSPEGEQALTAFVLFHDRVYEYRSARWPSMVGVQLALLLGRGPFAQGRRVKPFCARDGREIVARVVAVVDDHYIRHWNERLGHLVMFEAMPGTREAVKSMMDEACGWLQSHATIAARAGSGLLEPPFVIDEYEALLPNIMRQNPGYYHNLLKDAGFETEKGWVDYRIEVTPELAARYERALEAGKRAGFSIVAIKDTDSGRRVNDFTTVWNDAFKNHWGATPFTEDEVTMMLQFFEMSGAHETSVLAYRGGNPVGALMVSPEATEGALLKPGRVVKDSEKLNWLGIGVHESARGRGLNLAMASYAYLELIRRGAKYLSYTMVLDDNWPSRRTAEKLGGTACTSLVVYRRNFRG